MRKIQKAFTLVELIVVITILAILWTIAFILLSWYSAEARDAKRLTDIRNLYSKITIENTKWTSLEDLLNHEKTNSWIIINTETKTSEQWTVNFANLNENPENFKDPKTGENYVFWYAKWTIERNWKQEIFSFIQLATISEVKQTTKLVWNYFKFHENDSESILTDGDWNVLKDWNILKNDDSIIAQTTNCPTNPSPETYFTFSDWEIISYTWPANTDIIIPCDILGNDVTSIWDYAFTNNQITSLTIPDSVITIWDWAFDSNPITNLQIWNNVTTIWDNAFGSISITSLTIPDSVITIWDAAFHQNHLLENLQIWNNVTAIWSSAFYGNSLTNVIIPDSVKTIWGRAFDSNSLTNLKIWKNVESIWDQAFYNNSLTSLTIPDSVTTIWSYAFSQNQLTNATIWSNVTNIWFGAFDSNSLTNVEIWKNVINIWGYAFNNNNLTGIIIPNSVTTIWNYAFASNQLTGVKIPSSVTTIETEAFYSNSITNIEIWNGAISIWYQVFAYQNDAFSQSIPWWNITVKAPQNVCDSYFTGFNCAP